MTPVGAVSNRTASAQLETAPTKHGERKCLFILRIHHSSPVGGISESLDTSGFSERNQHLTHSVIEWKFQASL